VRILHVSPSFYPAWAYGGVPRCAFELCRALVRAGESVSVWTTDALDQVGRVARTDAVVDGIQIRYFPNVSNRLAYRHQLYLPRGLLRAVREQLSQFDLVHIHSHRHALEWVVSRAARAHKLPYVCTANGTVPPYERFVTVKRVIDVLGMRSVLQHAAACIAVSSAEVAHYRAAGVVAERITVIPNGVRLSDYDALPPRGGFRRRLGIAAEAPLVTFVGKITPRKGVDVLIRAFASLDPDVHLVVAGNFMVQEARVRALARECGVAGRVHFVGLLDGEEKLRAYVDADVVAYPSEREIFGLVPIEALMCNTAVVVCDDSGCGEVVRAADGGRLVPYGDDRALAAALRDLLRDPADRRANVDRGRRYVQTHFGWESIAEQTRRLYQGVVHA